MQSVTFTLADGGDEWLDETARVRGDAPVLDSALDAETQIARYADQGHPGLVLRLPVLYGTQAPSTLDALRFAEWGVAPVVGERQGWVTFIQAEDAARAFVAALQPPSGTYHVGSHPIRKGAFADALAALLGRRTLRVLPAVLVPWAVGSPARPFTRSHRIDSRRLTDHTHWTPHEPDPVDGWARAIDQAARAVSRRTTGAPRSSRDGRPLSF